MARDTFTDAIDFVTDNSAALRAELTGALNDIERGVGIARFLTLTTATGDVTLTDASDPMQSVDCNGADRAITLPANAATNGAFYIINKTAATYNLTVKNPDGSALTVIPPTKAAGFLSDGVGWHALLGRTPVLSTSVAVNVYITGSGTYTTPAGAYALLVECVGGGGQGGGSNTAAASAATGGGGGGGSYSRKYISSPAASYAYAVGAGGSTGAAGANGQAGSNTTFGSPSVCTAIGGNGGVNSAAGATNVFVGTGGAGGAIASAVGDYRAAGADGGTGYRIDGTKGKSGDGGGSMLGGAQAGITTENVGAAGVQQGGGGSGGLTLNGGTARAGGAGASGAIIVTAYCATLTLV